MKFNVKETRQATVLQEKGLSHATETAIRQSTRGK
jgi:hypothetical protein